MSPTILKFTCSHCQTPLTVPASMAGVEGPCPKCGQGIKAPDAPHSTAPASFAAEPREKPRTSHPAKIPEPREKPRSHEDFAGRPSIPPAPRGLPDRPAERKVAVKHSTNEAASTVSSRPRPSSESSSSSQESGSGFSRFVAPMLFAVVSAATVYLLLYHFMPGGPGQTNREVLAHPPETSTQPTGQQVQQPPQVNPPTFSATKPAPSPRNPATTPIAPAPAPEPVAPAEKSDLDEARTVLMSFFGRKTLEERLNMAEPARSAGPLKGGILDDTLPPVGEALAGAPTRNVLEDYLDIPFNVQFPIPDSADSETRDTLVIVRKRADETPKILIDPLLDLTGGALDTFAAEPVEGQQTFHAVVEAVPRCFEVEIPNADKKFTYKISSSTRQSEITRAYASLLSPLAEQLYSPDSGIGWGRRLRATIVLEWNTTEDPDHPFIEMREIKALDWNS